VKALIHVTRKQDVLDPQGKAIVRASQSLGYDGIHSVRQGKLFEVELDAADEATGRALLTELCEKLLANPVIEDYEVIRFDV
jgi:phosphoribosylformylglycinamidine synthase PurS subunit